MTLRIKNVEPILCDGGFRPWTFVKITTEEGIIGYGDCTDWTMGPTVATCLEQLAPLVEGRDASQI